jgi:putative hemolysin
MLEISSPTAPFSNSLASLFFKVKPRKTAAGLIRTKRLLPHIVPKNFRLPFIPMAPKAAPKFDAAPAIITRPPVAHPQVSGDATEEKSGLVVTWAKHLSEVRESQALRYQVFAGEMGANIKTSAAYPELDMDLFDDYCEHLIVRDEATQQVVGTYRLLTPVQAKRVGCFYTDTEFDLTRLRAQRDSMVELGRSCVHPDFRHGGVIMSLGRELFQFMARNQFSAMIGCASIPLNLGADVPASLWAKLSQSHMAPVSEQVTPRTPLRLDGLDHTLNVEPPPLLKGYLRLGTKVLGPPAWDAEFNSADLPVMAKMSDLSPRYKKHFQIDC